MPPNSSTLITKLLDAHGIVLGKMRMVRDEPYSLKSLRASLRESGSLYQELHGAHTGYMMIICSMSLGSEVPPSSCLVGPFLTRTVTQCMWGGPAGGPPQLWQCALRQLASALIQVRRRCSMCTHAVSAPACKL